MNTLLAFVSLHSGLAYGLVFLISLLESLVLVGLLLPGTMIMFGAGAVVATGGLSLFPVLLMAMAGAIAGDSISYWWGRHYKERLVQIWPFSRYPGMLDRGASFFHRHGGKSVLFGRFVGPVRPVIPVVAGMLGMGSAHFAVVNVLSAIGWALVYILPGVFFGTSLAMAGAVSTRLAVVVFILVAGAGAGAWACRRAISLIARKGPVWLSRLEQWAAGESSANRVVGAAQRFIRMLFFSGRGEALPVVFLAVTLFFAGWAFWGVLQDALAKGQLAAVDQAVYHFFKSLRTTWCDSVFVSITQLGDVFVNTSLALAVAVVLLLRRCYYIAGLWVLTVLWGMSGVQLLKWAIHLPRPMAMYHGISIYGFPSSHTAMSVILYGFLGVMLAPKRSGTWWILFSGVFLIPFVIGLSRLYLGANWFSYVLGGYCIGMSWTAFMGIVWLKTSEDKMPTRTLSFTVVLVIAITGGWHMVKGHDNGLVFYGPRQEEKAVTFSFWQAGGWRDLPAWRTDMEGEFEQPITVHWAGPPEDLARFLKGKGWRQMRPPGLKSLLGMFSPDTPVGQLPVLPRLHNGRMERWRLVRTDGDRRLVFRLWDAGIKIKGNDGSHLFVGAVEEQHGHSLAGLLTTARDSGDYDRPLDLLAKTLEKKFSVLRVCRMPQRRDRDPKPQQLHWQGRMLLAWETPWTGSEK